MIPGPIVQHIEKHVNVCNCSGKGKRRKERRKEESGWLELINEEGWGSCLFLSSRVLRQGRRRHELVCNTYRSEITNRGHTCDGWHTILRQQRAWSCREKILQFDVAGCSGVTMT
jgi:hypothetical protein